MGKIGNARQQQKYIPMFLHNNCNCKGCVLHNNDKDNHNDNYRENNHNGNPLLTNEVDVNPETLHYGNVNNEVTNNVILPRR